MENINEVVNFLTNEKEPETANYLERSLAALIRFASTERLSTSAVARAGRGTQIEILGDLSKAGQSYLKTVPAMTRIVGAAFAGLYDREKFLEELQPNIGEFALHTGDYPEIIHHSCCLGLLKAVETNADIGESDFAAMGVFMKFLLGQKTLAHHHASRPIGPMSKDKTGELKGHIHGFVKRRSGHNLEAFKEKFIEDFAETKLSYFGKQVYEEFFRSYIAKRSLGDQHKGIKAMDVPVAELAS